jgi:hypothetical protein
MHTIFLVLKKEKVMKKAILLAILLTPYLSHSMSPEERATTHEDSLLWNMFQEIYAIGRDVLTAAHCAAPLVIEEQQAEIQASTNAHSEPTQGEKSEQEIPTQDPNAELRAIIQQLAHQQAETNRLLQEMLKKKEMAR